MLAVSSPFQIYEVLTLSPPSLKATFWIENVRGKRRDNMEKDKNILLFLETGKSAVKFRVDAIT